MKLTMASPADTHCHLTAKGFDDDRGQVIQRALQKGVHWILVPGMDLESSRQAVAMAEEYSNLYAAVGFHPHHADDWTPTSSNELRSMASSEQVVAIGEIGLDYYRNYSSPQNQERAFRAQLDLAAELNLPVIIHNREATSPVMNILVEWVKQLNRDLQEKAGVLHAFSADLQAAREAIGAGFFLGIAGPISYKNSSALQHVVSNVSLSNLLIETDSPFLTPHPKRSRRNEPANVIVVAEHLSRILEKDYDTTVRITSQNAADLFGWQNANH